MEATYIVLTNSRSCRCMRPIQLIIALMDRAPSLLQLAHDSRRERASCMTAASIRTCLSVSPCTHS
eukprot:6209284-Pleurochrysis_carterae.AAC.3